jgi:hypothetical protein
MARQHIQSQRPAPSQSARTALPPVVRPFAAGQRAPVVQAKLRVTAPDDQYEREADRVAEQVVRGQAATPEEADRPAPQVMRKAAGGAAPAGVAVSPTVESGIGAARGGGRPLPGALRGQMERGVGHRFADVRLHTDGRAAALNRGLQARAFTTGRDIFFGAGEYRPASADGQRLLAHELTHVGQQSGGPQLVQRFAYDDDPTTWSPLTSIVRSAEGVDGVFFLTKSGTTIVVKPTADPGNIVYANAVMSSLSRLEAPKTKVHKKDAKHADPISTLLLANSTIGRTPTEVTEQVGGARYYVVMNAVQGASIQRLTSGDAAELVRNPHALREIGKLMVADAFLGNSDRLVGGAVNLGNFFFQTAAVLNKAGILSGRIATIDNDARFKRGEINERGNLNGDLENKRFMIEQLIDHTKRLPHIQTLLIKFNLKFPNVITNAGKTDRQIEAYISEGIDSGLALIASVFQNNMELVTSLQAINKTYGDPNEHRDIGAAKGLAKYARVRMAGNTEHDAVTKLKSYIEYKARQSTLKAGLKWLVRRQKPSGF